MDALASAEVVLLRGRLGTVELPAPALPGWQGLCAGEYALAMLRMRAAVALAEDALAGAALALVALP